MSEQKNPNDINFDDEFLNIEFDNFNANTHSDSATDIKQDTDLDELFNQTIPTSSKLSFELNTNTTTNTSHTSGLTDELNMGDKLTIDESMNIALSDLSTPNDAGVSLDFGKIPVDLPEHDVLHDDPSFIKSIFDDARPDGTDATLLGAAAIAGGLGVQKNKPAKKKGVSLFGKKESTPKAPKTPKTPKTPKIKTTQSANDKGDLTGLLSNPQKLNKMILGGVIALVLIGVALYMAMNNNESTPPPSAAPAASTPAPAAPVTPPADNTQVTADPAAATDTAAPTGDDILPEIKPVVNPDEILNAEIPNDPALIKEEIDRLADKETQIAEQEKLIQDQLTMMEDLTTAKAEHIALLEAQIAELEKQKGGSSSTAPTSNENK